MKRELAKSILNALKNNNQELNEKLAVLCGWKSPDHPDCKAATEGWVTGDKWWIDPEGMQRMSHDIPKYCDDLNATRKAEALLDYDGQVAFITALCPLVGLTGEGKYWCDLECHEAWRVANATARQRVEALLVALEND